MKSEIISKILKLTEKTIINTISGIIEAIDYSLILLMEGAGSTVVGALGTSFFILSSMVVNILNGISTTNIDPAMSIKLTIIFSAITFIGQQFVSEKYLMNNTTFNKTKEIYDMIFPKIIEEYKKEQNNETSNSEKISLEKISKYIVSFSKEKIQEIKKLLNKTENNNSLQDNIYLS
jgi:hypothetical protein